MSIWAYLLLNCYLFIFRNYRCRQHRSSVTNGKRGINRVSRSFLLIPVLWTFQLRGESRSPKKTNCTQMCAALWVMGFKVKTSKCTTLGVVEFIGWKCTLLAKVYGRQYIFQVNDGIQEGFVSDVFKLKFRRGQFYTQVSSYQSSCSECITRGTVDGMSFVIFVIPR